MTIMAHKGYEKHLCSQLHETTPEAQEARAYQGKQIMLYELPEGMTMEDQTIPGPEDYPELKVRIYRPAGLPEGAPMVLNVHGGGWVGGILDIDNARGIALAQGTPAVVVSVEYRLSGKEYHFPQPLMDLLAAYRWMRKEAASLGCSPERICLHGTSAGANLCAGLALWLRDHGEEMPAVAVLNCPCLSLNYAENHSYHQMHAYRMGPDVKAMAAESAFLGGYDGNAPSYYAFPGHCLDLNGLCAHTVIVGEYDTMRDDGLRYATRLLETGVPCETYVAPRVGHGFASNPGDLTDFVHQMTCRAFRRECGML